MNLGGQEIIVVLIIVLLLFGGQKIPELMRGIGKGIGELQKGIEESKRTLQASLHEAEMEDDDHKVHEIHPRPAEHIIPQGVEPGHVDEAS